MKSHQDAIIDMALRITACDAVKVFLDASHGIDIEPLADEAADLYRERQDEDLPFALEQIKADLT